MIQRCDGRRVRGYANTLDYAEVTWPIPWGHADLVGPPHEAIKGLEELARRMNIVLLCECTPEQVLIYDIEQAVRENKS